MAQIRAARSLTEHGLVSSAMPYLPVRIFTGGKEKASSRMTADYVIREHALEAGCVQVATCDRKLLKHDGYVSP